jgi:hypothetical protein
MIWNQESLLVTGRRFPLAPRAWLLHLVLAMPAVETLRAQQPGELDGAVTGVTGKVIPGAAITVCRGSGLIGKQLVGNSARATANSTCYENYSRTAWRRQPSGAPVLPDFHRA